MYMLLLFLSLFETELSIKVPLASKSLFAYLAKLLILSILNILTFYR